MISSKIKAVNIPNKGYGFVATQRIKPNEVLITDDIITVEDKYIFSDIFQLLYKVFNNPNLLKKFMALYPKKITPKIKMDSKMLATELDKVKTTNKTMYNYFVSNFTESELVLYCMKYMCNAFCYNELPAPKESVVGLACGAKQPLPAFLFVGRLLNHSCMPNTVFNQVGDKMVFISVRAIEKGEEITDNYVPIIDPYHVRQKRLREQYGFECCCTRCLTESKKKYTLQYDAEIDRIIRKKIALAS
jgi:hypothetical protein